MVFTFTFNLCQSFYSECKSISPKPPLHNHIGHLQMFSICTHNFNSNILDEVNKMRNYRYKFQKSNETIWSFPILWASSIKQKKTHRDNKKIRKKKQISISKTLNKEILTTTFIELNDIFKNQKNQNMTTRQAMNNRIFKSSSMSKRNLKKKIWTYESIGS